MWPFNTCCLCCKLETGAYTLAILGFIANIISIIVCSLFLGDAIDNPGKISKNVFIFGVVWALLSFLTFVMLLMGTKRKEKRLLIPFLVLSMISIVLQSIAQIMGITKLGEAKQPIAAQTIAFIIGLIVGIYVWLCMLSLYIKIKKGPNQSVGYMK